MGFIVQAPDGSIALVYGSPSPLPAPAPQLPASPFEDDSPCSECWGSGEVTVIDWVPYGDGDVPLEQTFVCDVCEGLGFKGNYPSHVL